MPENDNIYIHVPFCSSKCGYCAFYSEPAPCPDLIDKYLAKLEEDFSGYQPVGPIDSIFIGGGTPSLLPPEHLERLFTLITKSFQPDDKAEISIECNPETVTAEKAGIIASFVNRVSVGVQSFSPVMLKRLGRQAGPDDIDRTLELLHRNAIDNLNIDLIYGIPGQSQKDFAGDLKEAVDLGIKHISCYALTREETAALSTPELAAHLTDDEAETEMWFLSGNTLAKSGIIRYEISNYASPKYRCRHNLNVWHGQRYTGFGPAACSFDGVLRKTEATPLQSWLNGEPPELDQLDPYSRALEVFAMGLRTVDGWTREEWEKCALPEKISWNEISQLPGLQEPAIITEERIKLNEIGLLFWDNIAMEILD